MQPESKIQLSILKYLEKNNFYVWRNTNLVRFDRKTKKYIKNPYHKSGLGDIIGLFPEKSKFFGRHLEVEVKTPTGKQSPAQKIHQKRIEANGGVYILARSVKDVTDKLSTLKY